MNGTSTSAAESLIPASRAILTRNWIPSLIFGILGLIGTFENLLIIVIIFRGHLTKAAHHYVIMQSLAAFDVYNSLVTTCVGFKRFILFASGDNEVSSAARCEVDLLALQFATTLPVLCTLLMAIDRFFGVAAPISHTGMNRKKMTVCHYILCALWVAFTAITLAGAGPWPGPLVPACLFGQVVTVVWVQFLETYTNLCLEILLGLVYAALLVVMAIRRHTQAALGNQFDLSIAVAKTTAFILAVFVLTFIGADVIDTVFIYYNPSIIPYFGPWFLCMKFLPSILNLPVYIWKNEQFRDQLKAALKKVGAKPRTTKVKPIPKVAPGH